MCLCLLIGLAKLTFLFSPQVAVLPLQVQLATLQTEKEVSNRLSEMQKKYDHELAEMKKELIAVQKELIAVQKELIAVQKVQKQHEVLLLLYILTGIGMLTDGGDNNWNIALQGDLQDVEADLKANNKVLTAVDIFLDNKFGKTKMCMVCIMSWFHHAWWFALWSAWWPGFNPNTDYRQQPRQQQRQQQQPRQQLWEDDDVEGSQGIAFKSLNSAPNVNDDWYILE